MGMTVQILRTMDAPTTYEMKRANDCTAQGLTQNVSNLHPTYTSLCIENVEGPFEPSEALTHKDGVLWSEKDPIIQYTKSPAATLTTNFCGDPIIVCEPTKQQVKAGRTLGPMMGGNYATTSDSRFSQALRKLGVENTHIAIPIHDRYE